MLTEHCSGCNSNVLISQCQLAVSIVQGFGDEPYKTRRVSISELARSHQVYVSSSSMADTASQAQ